MNINGTPQQVVLQEPRGQFSGFTSVNTSKYHAAYVNDDWEMSKYATLSLGVRWEQQRMSTGGGVTQVLGDQWNPRIGFSVDPKGDRKSKIYANFGRYVTVNPNPVKFTGSTLPGQCVDSNGVSTPYSALNLTTSLGTALGSICYPSVNEPSTWSIANPDCGGSGQPACAPGDAFVVDPNALFGGEGQPDGVPDGYPNATRNYQAIEIEVNKSLSHNWSLISNWRIAWLQGNFEGAFRNDNGQNDPGISSLYDFTPGVLGEIGFQVAPGPLNADRLHIVNIYPTYTFDKTFLRGLIVTPGVRIQSGLPFTTLVAQEPYVNTGEVPINGRGDLGRGPVTGTVDVHLDYPWRISESKSLHFSVDLMNIANSKRNLQIDQFADVTFGLKSADYTKPGYYPYPFNAAGQNLVLGFMEPFSTRFHVSFNF
jgi:TonB dependent receptor